MESHKFGDNIDSAVKLCSQFDGLFYVKSPPESNDKLELRFNITPVKTLNTLVSRIIYEHWCYNDIV